MKHLLTIISCFVVLSMSAQVPDYVPQDDLVAWYDFADGACDASGLAGCFELIDGAYIGEVEGSDDLALRLDGNYAQLPADPNFNLSVFTIAFRYLFDEGSRMRMWKGNPDYPDDVNYTIASDEASDNDNFRYTENCDLILDYSSNGFSADDFESPEVWLNVVVTRSSTGVVSLNTSNSSDVFTGTPTICNETQPIRIGHWWDGDPSPSFGWVDHLGFWSTVLSELEIAQLLQRELVSIGCTDVNSCNYDPLAEFDDGSCVPAGCMDVDACNFNSEAGCDDGSCLVLDPLLCDADSIIEVDLCGQDSIQLGFVSGELQSFIPLTQLNWKSSCEFQEGWNHADFDDTFWNAPIQTVCGGSTSGNQLAAQYLDCGGDDHMIWAGDCSSSYFRFPLVWDGNSPLSIELGADDSFEVFLNGEFVFEGAGWETCYLVDLFQNAIVGENLLAIETADIGSCKGLFGKAYGPSFQQNFLWSTGQTSSQIWVDSPDIYTVDSFEEDVTVAFIVTSDNIQGCTDGSACNYDELAECDDSSCVYPLLGGDCSLGAVSCGQGTVWDSTNQVCIPSPSICNEGTYWDDETQTCMPINSCPEDLNYDGIVGVADLLTLLSSFGTPCDPPFAEWTCGDPVSYHGYDYETVLIGSQCWFAENLRTNFYGNGEPIPTNLSDENWFSTNQGAFSYCDDNVSIANASGNLYNWWVIEDSRGICPSFWSVPSDDQWMQLEVFLGMPDDELYNEGTRGTTEGSALKSATWGGNNTTGFSAIPGGNRHFLGFYQNCDDWAHFWTSSEYGGSNAWERQLYYSSSGIVRHEKSKSNGQSIRCIKD